MIRRGTCIVELLFFHFLSLVATAFTPSLLNPILLMSALSFGKRNNLGFSLPGWGRGVTVPISTKPNPRQFNSLRYLAFLSKPAPRPTGLQNFRSQISG